MLIYGGGNYSLDFCCWSFSFVKMEGFTPIKIKKRKLKEKKKC